MFMYVHKIHLHILILQYVSPLLFKILEIYKLHEIPYDKLHKWCKCDRVYKKQSYLHVKFDIANCLSNLIRNY